MKSGKDIFTRRGHVFFLFSFWILYTAYIIHSAYFKQLYISPDSSNYLREAEAILSGNGFNSNYAAGIPGWFSAWPVGYPALIALSSLISGCNTYLASKLLTSALIGLELYIFAKHFKAKSWLYALILTNYGIISINRFTWSETAFMPLLLVYALALSEILCNEDCPAKYYVVLWLSMSGAFMVRYFGAFTVIVSMIAALMLFMFRREADRSRILKLFLTAFFAGLFMAVYLLMNKMMGGYATGVNRTVFTDSMKELTVNLAQSIVLEVKNILSFIAAPRLNVRARWLVPAALPVIAVFVHIIAGRLRAVIRKKKFDEPSVFFIIGICYYAAFTVIRFRSSMDPFGYRFWAPASMLILTGLVTCFYERFRKWDGFTNAERRIKIFGAVIMFALAVVIAAKDFRTVAGNTAYTRTGGEVREYFEGVPSGTVILVRSDWEDDEGEYHKGEEFDYSYANFFRRDIIITSAFRTRQAEDYSMEHFRRRHKGCKYFGVSKYCYESEMVKYPELRSAFGSGEKVRNFIIIPAD